MIRKKKVSKRMMVFREMPELTHYVGKGPGVIYDPEKSEVLEWIKGQNGVIEWVMEIARGRGLIEYDSETNKWRGSEAGKENQA